MSKRITLIALLLLGHLLAGCRDTSVEWALTNVEVERINRELLKEQNKTGGVTLVHRAGVQITDDFWVWLGGKSMPGVNHEAADKLLNTAIPKLPDSAPVLVASFVNLDTLSESSTFGRVVAEQIASRLKQKGYAAIEMKLRTNVFIREGSGEFLLSREITEISTKHDAQAVVVGTYAVALSKIYLTTRIVSVKDGRVLSSYDYTIPISGDTFKLLLKDKNVENWLL